MNVANANAAIACPDGNEFKSSICTPSTFAKISCPSKNKDGLGVSGKTTNLKNDETRLTPIPTIDRIIPYRLLRKINNNIAATKK